MGNDTVMMLRLPKALKVQIDQEAKDFGVSTSDLVRKKLQAVSLPSAPVVRILKGRLPGAQLLRIEVPLSVKADLNFNRLGVPKVVRYKPSKVTGGLKAEGAIRPDE